MPTPTMPTPTMPTPTTQQAEPAMVEMTAAELTRAGLLHTEAGASISRYALFVPADYQGVPRPVTVAAGARIEAFAVVHGGTVIGEQVRVETHAVVGRPERGYAMGLTYPGDGGDTTIGAGTLLRAGVVVYAGVDVGEEVLIGHHALLRSDVSIGSHTQLGHNLTVERASRIGHDVRCSPGSHITSATMVADWAFLGAGITTINERHLIWRDPDRAPVRVPPTFEYGCKVGTGCVVLGGITVGREALVGAGSLINKDIPAGALAYGSPVRLHGHAPR